MAITERSMFNWMSTTKAVRVHRWIALLVEPRPRLASPRPPSPVIVLLSLLCPCARFQVAVVAIAQMLEQKRLHISDRVCKFVPEVWAT